MNTTFPNKQDIEKKWYIVDAQDQILGRLSTKVANLLRGKDKTCFSPHVDCGDFVVITNAKKIKLTGNKLEEKYYYRHSGYKGSLKKVNAATKLKSSPEDVIRIAVSGMLPKNRLRKKILAKLKIFAGEEHTHEAQKPIEI